MGHIFLVGVAAILMGLALLSMGGVGHHSVRVSIKEGSVLGQAWFVVLFTGLLLMFIDLYRG
ncbi:hypothetical protein KAW53_06485 [Candidatus Bathyarchaeota archaeon]|jgi:hypothetical protein|nr:hypothetical protein [Candidatus Bathyarchaeota archaeon]